MPDTATHEPPEVVSVHVALARVMRDLPAIGKKRNQGGGDEDKGIKYAYRGIEQITTECQDLFAKHGVVMVPHVDSIEVKDITVNQKPWTDTTMLVTYTLVGPDGSTLTARCAGIGRDNSDKGANKAMTQAFKYLLLQVLCISDAKDDADGSTHEADAPRADPNVLAAQQTYARLVKVLELPGAKAAIRDFGGTHGKGFGEADLDDPTWRALVVAELDRIEATAPADDQATLPV